MQDAAALVHHLETSNRRAFVAWHTLANFYYLVRPTRGDDDVRRFLDDLTRFVLVAPTDTEMFRFALGLPMKDFEDAMQVGAARACGAEMIATRNVSDFERSPIPARTPAEVLEILR